MIKSLSQALPGTKSDSIVPVPDRSGLRAALENTDGSVTGFLERLVGESIDARAHHHVIVAPALNGLNAPEGETLLQRVATLWGRTSGSAYVYAESLIATNRLPARFCHRLESSIDPIGRILDEMGIAVTRNTLVATDAFVTSAPVGDEMLRDYLLARTYRIDSERKPLMIINEWFLKTLRPFLISA